MINEIHIGPFTVYMYGFFIATGIFISGTGCVARATGTELINISSPFLEYNNYSDLLCIDGIHPNEEGHKLIAGTIIKSLLKENENL